jgi:hypothetical protein
VDHSPENKEPTAPPFSLRLTLEERALLSADADGMPLGAYIRAKIFATPNPRKRNFRYPVRNEKALAALLAELGRTRLANNLNQLAKASHKGFLALTPESERAIIEACSDLQRMRKELLAALGLAEANP